MKKQQAKFLIKITLLLFITILLNNCEKDDTPSDFNLQTETQDNNFLVKNIEFSKIQNNTNLIKQLNLFSDNSSNLKNTNQTNSSFSINKNSLVHIKTNTDSSQTYSFSITRHNSYNTPNLVENLVLKTSNNTNFEAYIFKYYFPNGITNKDNFEIVDIQSIDPDSTGLFSKSIPTYYTIRIIEIKHDCYTGTHTGADQKGDCDYEKKGGTPPYSTYVVEVSQTGTKNTRGDGLGQWSEIPKYGGSGGGSSSAGANSGPTLTSPVIDYGSTQAEFVAAILNLSTKAEIAWLRASSKSDLDEIIVFLEKNKNSETEYKNEAITYLKGQIQLKILYDKNKVKLQPKNGKINNRDDQKYTHYGTNGVYGFYKMEDGSTVISSPTQLILNSDGQLVAKFTSEINNSHYWYIKLEGSSEWANYLLKSSSNLADELRTTALLSAEALGKAIGKYVLPIEDIKILIDGKDFEGQQIARYKAAGFLILAIVPGTKAFKLVGNASKAIGVVVKIGSNNLVVDTAKAGLKVVTNNNVIKFLSKTGDEIARIVDGVMTFKYSGFGGNIITNPNKTTTLIGKWDNLKHIWNTGLAKHGSNKGGLNILGEPFGNNVAEVWANNRKWLDRAISRGDIIRTTANPLDINNVFYKTNGVPNSAFQSISSLKNYLINLPPNKINDLGYYGREIRYLFQNGYNFNNVTKTFIK